MNNECIHESMTALLRTQCTKYYNNHHSIPPTRNLTPHTTRPDKGMYTIIGQNGCTCTSEWGDKGVRGSKTRGRNNIGGYSGCRACVEEKVQVCGVASGLGSSNSDKWRVGGGGGGDGLKCTCATVCEI